MALWAAAYPDKGKRAIELVSKTHVAAEPPQDVQQKETKSKKSKKRKKSKKSKKSKNSGKENDN